MISPRKLFLIDGIGALLSAFFLGFVLPSFQLLIGMPSYILYLLALLASLFAFYSLINYANFGPKWRAFLKGIAIINWAYCILSVALIFQFYDQLTAIGLFYFIGEKIIVVSLAFIEWQTATINFAFSSSDGSAKKNKL